MADIRNQKYYSFVKRSGVNPSFPNVAENPEDVQQPLNPEGVPIPRSYLDLNDTDSTYEGQSGKVPKVKSDETGLEFSDSVGIQGLQSVTDIGNSTTKTIIHASATNNNESALLGDVKAITGLRSNLNTVSKDNLVQGINEANAWRAIEW